MFNRHLRLNLAKLNCLPLSSSFRCLSHKLSRYPWFIHHSLYLVLPHLLLAPSSKQKILSVHHHYHHLNSPGPTTAISNRCNCNVLLTAPPDPTPHTRVYAKLSSHSYPPACMPISSSSPPATLIQPPWPPCWLEMQWASSGFTPGLA